MAAIWDSQAMGTTAGIPCVRSRRDQLGCRDAQGDGKGPRVKSWGARVPPQMVLVGDPPLALGSSC